LANYIDWTPFFQTWELHGKFPRILKDEIAGEEATRLYEDAQQRLKTIIEEKWLEPKGVIGLFPANSVGDDIEIYSPETNELIYIQRTLRQQTKKTQGQPNMALSDFIAPKESGIKDYIGGFAVTSGLGMEPYLEQFKVDHDDY